jgi:hypothetical protein
MERSGKERGGEYNQRWNCCAGLRYRGSTEGIRTVIGKSCADPPFLYPAPGLANWGRGPLNRRPPPADSSTVANRNDNHPRPAAAFAVFCRDCSSPLVQASGWMKQDESRWKVRLWCPECWREHSAVLDGAQAACLSLAVEEGFAAVLEALEGLDAIMTTEPGSRRGRNSS